jgi:hypothetical protein
LNSSNCLSSPIVSGSTLWRGGTSSFSCIADTHTHAHAHAHA